MLHCAWWERRGENFCLLNIKVLVFNFFFFCGSLGIEVIYFGNENSDDFPVIDVLAKLDEKTRELMLFEHCELGNVRRDLFVLFSPFCLPYLLLPSPLSCLSSLPYFSPPSRFFTHVVNCSVKAKGGCLTWQLHTMHGSIFITLTFSHTSPHLQLHNLWHSYNNSHIPQRKNGS